VASDASVFHQSLSRLALVVHRGREFLIKRRIDATGLKESEGGLLWAFRFDQNSRPVLLEGLPLRSTQRRLNIGIGSLLALPRNTKVSLIDQDGGLRLEVEGDTVYAAISDFKRDLSWRTQETAKLSFTLNRHFFVSMRRHALYSTDRVGKNFKRG